MLRFNPTNMRKGADELQDASRGMHGDLKDFMDFEIASTQTADDPPLLLADVHKCSTGVSDMLQALASRSTKVAEEIGSAADRVEQADDASANNLNSVDLKGGLKAF